jgi:hypothetical protein
MSEQEVEQPGEPEEGVEEADADQPENGETNGDED